MDVGLLKLVIVVILVGVGYFRGRRNERRHLAELANREQALRNVLLFATRYPPTHAGTLDPRLVTGCAVIAADHFKAFVAGLRKFVGGRFSAYETLVDRARREALLRMKEQARMAGCDMVFNVRVETTTISSGAEGVGEAVEVLAYGTAFAPAIGSVEQSPLRYVPGVPLPDQEVGGFNLATHPATRWTLVAWVALIGWGFVELVALKQYWYADDAPWIAFAVIAIAAFGAGSWALYRRRVPLGTAVGFSLVLCATLPPLLFMPALRVNGMTDLSPVVESRYRLDRNGSLTPLEPAWPELRFPEYSDYFAAQPVGSEHTFILRRGWLGFWQLERAPFAERLNDFYRSRPRR